MQLIKFKCNLIIAVFLCVPLGQGCNEKVKPQLSESSSPAVEKYENTLKPGDPAPDFTLNTINGNGKVSLSDFKGKKPVALMFGSYT